MEYMSKNFSSQISGQIGIIVVLITAAILTFGLSVANRVVQENKVVVDRSDSIRTFNTAETGIDEALNQIYQFESGTNATLNTGIIVNDPLNQVSLATSQTFEGNLTQGENLKIDLKNQVATSNITLFWSSTDCSVSSQKNGLFLTFIHFAGGEYQSHYYLIAGENDCLFDNQQNFIIGNSTPAGTYKYNIPLTLPSFSDGSLHIQTIGADTDLQIVGDVGLIDNAQYQIESLARSENDISNKTIEVTKSLPSAPSFMSFALFSGNDIVK
jgi:Tfp pilus assembly protein PilX